MEPDHSFLREVLAREATKQSTREAVEAPATSQQVGGSHYLTMAIQPIEFSMANGLDACQHTAIKYIVRRKGPSRIEDIDKAIHILRIYREMLTRGTTT